MTVMITTGLAFIFTIIFQIISFWCIKVYGLATYEYCIAQVVTFCWAGLLFVSEMETTNKKEETDGTHQ